MADEISLDDLFRRPEEQPADPATRVITDFAEARRRFMENYRENQVQFGNMVTPRMRQARERQIEAARQETAPAAVEVTPAPPRPAFLIDWYSEEWWKTPEGAYRITDMVDQHLWNTVIWCTRNVEALYQAYEQMPASAVLALAARRWLRVQTAFRALVRESIRRQLAFPNDVSEYIRRYLLDKDEELATFEPWDDPIAKERQRDLQEFLTRPANIINEEEYGKPARVIDI